LTTLVEAYEEQHFSIPTPDPVEAVQYFIESRGLTRKDLEPYLGSRARVSEILSRKRPLTLRMIQRLHRELGIPAEVLLTPYSVRRTPTQRGPAPKRRRPAAPQGQGRSARAARAGS
jgi:HTH-type transcriptional regulator/antitoxin HigA